MFDFLQTKALAASIPFVVGAIKTLPMAIRFFKRWKNNRHRRCEAAVVLTMKKFREYEENNLALKANTLQDLLISGVFFFGFISAIAFAAQPSKNVADMWGTLFLALEGLIMMGMSIYWFSRVGTRLAQARHPERTKLLNEIRLMKARLNRLEKDIIERGDPILCEEAQVLRVMNRKLPSWKFDAQ